MVENILAVWYASNEAEKTEGREWYDTAHGIADRIGARCDVDTVVASAVLSILSPSNRWDRNVRDAETMLTAWKAGASIDSFSVSTYGPNKRKAWSLLRGEIEPSTAFSNRAQKTRAFFELIADPCGRAVVVDGHALCIALGERVTLDSVPSVGIKAYREVAEAYRLAADELGEAPHAVQAVTWLAWRNTHLAPHYIGDTTA